MDIFLFLITIFYLPLIKTTPQPFIDCNGKSFLCENSTHFTICVNVGGGLSMTVGNIILPCPPTTFCDEMNAFECEYHASTTQNSFLRDIDTYSEVTEAPFTTNIYDEFLYTNDLQHTKETIVNPTEGNTKVNFKDDTDYAVLLYDNTYDAIPKNRNDTKSEQINELKNKDIDVNKKFTRRNKEPNQEFEKAHYELSTIMDQTTDITDKISTFTELSSDNVNIVESSTIELVTAIKIFDDSATPSSIFVEYFGNNLKHVNNFALSSQTNSNNSVQNNKNVELTNAVTVNKFVNNGFLQLQPKIIESSTPNALTTNSILSDVVSNENMVINTSSTHGTIKEKTIVFGIEPENSILYTNLERAHGFTTENLGTLEENISYQTTLKNNQLEDIADTIVFHDLLLAATADETVASDLSTTPKTYDQNDKFSKAIIPTDSSDIDISFGDLLKANKDFIELETSTQIHFTDVDNSTILDSTIKPENQEILNDSGFTPYNNSVNYGLLTNSSEHLTPFNFDISNNTEGDTHITSFANRALKDDNFQSRSQNTSVTNNSTIMSNNNNVMLPMTEANTTSKLFLNEAIQDKITNDEKSLNENIILRNKLEMNGIEPENSTLCTNSENTNGFTTEKNNTLDQNISYQTPLKTKHLADTGDTIVFQDLLLAVTTDETITSEMTTTPDTNIQNDEFSKAIIPENSSAHLIEKIATVADETVSSVLGTTPETYIQSDIYSIANMPTMATTVNETVTSDLSQTPEPYILSKPSIPSDSSNFDISFGDLLKVNKDFTELKTPTQVHFTNIDDSSILDSTIEPEYKESLKRSTPHNNPLNYSLRTKFSENITPFGFDIFNSTEENTPIIPFANRTITGDNFENDATLIVVNKTLNRGLFLEDTNNTPNPIFFFQNTNIDLNKTAITNETTKPRYNLASNLLHITTEAIPEEGYPKSIEKSTIDKTTYLTNVHEQRIIDKVPISHVLLTNVTRENYKNLNDKNIEDVEIIQAATAITAETQEGNKIIKRTNSQLLNDSFIVLDHSTQSSSEVTDFYITNIDDTKVNSNKSENATINLIEGNTQFFLKSETRVGNQITTLKSNSNRGIVNNSKVAILENITESGFNISNITTYIIDKKIVNNNIDQVDLKKSKATNYQEKQITILENLSETTVFDILELQNDFTVDEPTNVSNGYARVSTNGYAEVITYGYTEEITNPSIMNDTFDNLINNVAQTMAPISNSINDKEMETKFIDHPIVSEDITEATIAKHSIIYKIPEKQLKENRKENINDSALNNPENFTQRTLETQIPIDASVDLIKHAESATSISSSANNKGQKIDFTKAPAFTTDHTVVPIVTSSLMIDNMQEKQLFVNENINEIIALNNTDNFTQHSLDKPISIDDELHESIFVNDTVINNQDIFYNVKHNIQDSFRPTLNIPNIMVPTENTHLTIEYLSSEIISNKSSDNNNKILDQKATETTYKTYEKNISTIGNNQKILNDTFVNSLNKGAQASTISSSIDNNDQDTYLILENMEEKVTEDVKGLNAFLKEGTEHVNSKGTTHSPDNYLSSFNLLKPTISTLNVLNETNNSTTKATIETNKGGVSLNDSGLHRFLQANDSIMTEATYNITSAIDKFAQKNLNLKGDYNLIKNKPVIRIGLQFNLQDITTKSIDTIVKVNESIIVDDITESSQYNNIGATTLLEGNKNEPLIQNCSDRSNCLSQVDRSMSIELHNKPIKGVSLKENTDSKTEKMRLQENDRTLNANSSNVWLETRLGTDGKIVMKTNDGTSPLIPIYLHRKFVGVKDIDNTDVINNTKMFKDGLQLQTSDLGQFDVSDNLKSSTNPLKREQLINNLTNKNHEWDKSHVNNNSRQMKVTMTPLMTAEQIKSKENKNEKNDEKPVKKLQNSNLLLQSLKTTPKTNILETPNAALTFDCSNHSRGRYADKDNCRKFYICIGYVIPIVGRCPVNTVFSELRKQCTNNLSQCIRNNQFKCVKEGRFIDVWQENMYYLCVNGSDNRFSRFKFQCKNGYVLDSLNVTCKQTKNTLKLSSSSNSSSPSSSSNSSSPSSSSNSSSSSSSDKKKRNNSSKKSKRKLSNETRFKCNEEGKFVDPNNCRKYYVCTKTSKSGLRRKKKKCDSDEVFDADEKRCVDEDSYECK